jgi:hypothetical protein
VAGAIDEMAVARPSQQRKERAQSAAQHFERGRCAALLDEARGLYALYIYLTETSARDVRAPRSTGTGAAEQ